MKLPFFAFLSVTLAIAQTSETEMFAHLKNTASSYALYQEPAKALPKNAPLTYKPFYISHYGRHGSRYHYSSDDYHCIYKTFEKANLAQALTETGKSLFLRTKYLKENASPRAGDLTQKGVAQHEGIALRMVQNFPEIFKNKKYTPHIDAYASVSGRCIVSMGAFLESLRSRINNVDIRMESGKSLMPFISSFNFENDSAKASFIWNEKANVLWQNVHDKNISALLFTDSSYALKNVEPKFYAKLFEIHGSLQNLDDDFFNGERFDFSDIFTPQEQYDRWQAQNSYWYGLFGKGGRANDYSVNTAKKILEHILKEANKAIERDTTNNAPIAATLRFGHDMGIMPLAHLMQLSIASANVQDPNELFKHWNDFKIIPMAANLQIVFYKSVKKDNPILVRFLYNEKEITVPVPCYKNCSDNAHYYRWDDVYNFYLTLIQ